MKKGKFTEEQIAYASKQAEPGTPVAEVCRKMGISDATFYNWRTKYGGLSPSELRRLKQLEEENAKFKRLVADLSLDKAMLQDVLSKVDAYARSRSRTTTRGNAWRLKSMVRCVANTLSPRWLALRIIVRFPAISRQIMAASSFRRRSINGRTRMAWRLTSRVLASRPTTQRINPSTDASGRNASTRIGSCRWRTPDAKSRSGASTITRRALILRCSG